MLRSAQPPDKRHASRTSSSKSNEARALKKKLEIKRPRKRQLPRVPASSLSTSLKNSNRLLRSIAASCSNHLRHAHSAANFVPTGRCIPISASQLSVSAFALAHHPGRNKIVSEGRATAGHNFGKADSIQAQSSRWRSKIAPLGFASCPISDFQFFSFQFLKLPLEISASCRPQRNARPETRLH